MVNFKVVIPVYNSEKWIAASINSLLNQTYKNYQFVVINDHSTDMTGEIIKAIGVPCLFNEERRRVMYNVIKGFNFLSPIDDDVLMVLDGDDWLADNSVLEYLAGIYEDPNIWLTYGQFEPVSHTYHDYCTPLTTTQGYRKECRDGFWRTSQLRTYRYKIFKLIKDEDLRGKDGLYYPFAHDWATMFPMVEMCGLKRIKFVKKVIYLYNDANPLCDMYVNPELEIALGNEIANKPCYAEIL